MRKQNPRRRRRKMSKTPECHQNVNYCEKKVKKVKNIKYVKSISVILCRNICKKEIIRTESSTENITVLEKNIGSIPTVTVLQIKS